MITMTVPTIKRTMKSIGLGDRANDFLAKIDEMELDAMLARNIAGMNRGEGIPRDEFMSKMRVKFASRYYADNI